MFRWFGQRIGSSVTKFGANKAPAVRFYGGPPSEFATSGIRKNRLKAALAQGQVPIGLWTHLRNTMVAECLTQHGFDWLVIDMEHGPNELVDVLLQVQVAQPGSAEPVVRLPWNDFVLVKRLLDIGATTLLFPMINTVEEAEAAVRATRYPPNGIRGVMSAARMNRYGLVKDYYQRAAEEICVIVQCETEQALKQLPNILKVNGVDAVFVGPADMAASLGHIGNPGHPEVVHALKEAAKLCKSAGKPCGIISACEKTLNDYHKWGYSFFALGTDLGLLVTSATEALRKFRQVTLPQLPNPTKR